MFNKLLLYIVVDITVMALTVYLFSTSSQENKS